MHFCAGHYKLKEHKCEENGCKVRFGKIYNHVATVCENCGGSQQAKLSKYLARQKAKKKARKKKGSKAEKKISK